MIADICNTGIVKRAKQFLRNSSGGMAVPMALSMIPIFMATGIGIDVARITREQAAFQAAMESATLAISADDRAATEGLEGVALTNRLNELKALAMKYVKANYTREAGASTSITLDVRVDGQKVQLKSTHKFPTTLMRYAGISDLELEFFSEVQKAMRPIEMALVFDTTGSMKNDMAGLKNAAKKLLESFYGDSPGYKPNQSEYIRIALVPFSGAVRLDTAGFDFNMDWIDVAGNNPLSRINFTDPTWNNHMAWGQLRNSSGTALTWNGCVESRSRVGSGGQNFITSDAAPSGGDVNSRFPAYFNPDSPSYYPSFSTYVPTNTSGDFQNQVYMNNNYINAYQNYTTSASNTSLLNPSGSRRTGYDDSVIGNNTYDANTRFKNQAKYINKQLPTETYTLQGDGVTWSVPSGPWNNCTASKVVPMTHNRSKIEAGIDSMKAYGGTNIAEGLAWGMRVLSPTQPFTRVEGSGTIPNGDIAPYNGPRWNKVLVLMTDGENDPYSKVGTTPITLFDTGTSYNSYGFVRTTTTGNLNRYGSTSYTNAATPMNNDTQAICTSLKNNGVEIYAVGYKVDSPLMANCATDAGHYVSAQTMPQLITFFNHIGKMVYVSK
jgi:hypothetical protein